jgi:hypothetical protein
MQNLVIDGIIHQIDASFSLRWVEQENGQPYPVLYKNGKRVVKSWSLVLNYISPEDPFGGNANTN